MSRPHLLPPLTPATAAALDRLAVGGITLVPRHEVGAEADPRLLEIIRNMDIAEKNLRAMAAALKAGELVTWGAHEGKPLGSSARWAKRTLAAFTEISRVAAEAGDDAFPLHLEAIRRGRENPPLPMRVKVWMAWRWCSLARRIDVERLIESQCLGATCEAPEIKPYLPSAGEVAASIGASDKVLELTVRDCTNHLQALGLPYAPARRGKRKSI